VCQQWAPQSLRLRDSRRDLAPRLQTYLCVDPLNVPFGGPPRDGQLLGDLAIAPAPSHQDRHLQLTTSELPELCAHQPSPAPLKHSTPVVLPVTPRWNRPSLDAMGYRRNWLVLGLQSGLLGVLVGCSQPASPVPQTPSSAGLTAAEHAQLARLETGAFKLPAMPTDGHCPTGPESSVAPYPRAYIPLNGAGPVYGQGGPQTDSSENSYFDVTLFTDPTV